MCVVARVDLDAWLRLRAGMSNSGDFDVGDLFVNSSSGYDPTVPPPPIQTMPAFRPISQATGLINQTTGVIDAMNGVRGGTPEGVNDVSYSTGWQTVAAAAIQQVNVVSRS